MKFSVIYAYIDINYVDIHRCLYQKYQCVKGSVVAIEDTAENETGKDLALLF